MDVVSQLPVDLVPFVTALQAEAGIDVAQATGRDADLAARVASGDLPDVAIVSRPALVAELARAGLPVDLSGFVDVARLRSIAGDYLVGLGTLGADGSWPAEGGRLDGAPIATEAESLVWYPRAGFERAGYEVPRTWADLRALTARMIADGRNPWCLGIKDGAQEGASAVDVIEDLVLHAAGPDAYDGWIAGDILFQGAPVWNAFVDFGQLAFTGGSVLGGIVSAIDTPQRIAGWPMFVDPPSCWLHVAGGTDRLSWPAGKSGSLAAFPFPAADPAYAGMVRGRSYSVVVFQDRPEVRRFVGGLLGSEPAAVAASLVPAGIWPVGYDASAARLDDVSATEAALLGGAIRAGTFRVSASDLMSSRVAAAFASGAVQYLIWGQPSVRQVLEDIDGSRRATQ